MNDFEIRYNAMEHAMLLMIQRLTFEVANTKGDQASKWVEGFRNAIVTEINDTMNLEAGAKVPRPNQVSEMAKSIVEGVATMTKERLAELK